MKFVKWNRVKMAINEGEGWRIGYVKIKMDHILRQFLDIFKRLLETQNFFLKNYPLAQQLLPFRFKKYFFYISSSHFTIKAKMWHLVSRFQNGIILRHWKYVWIFFGKYCWKYFLKRYLQKVFSIPKCNTILELWDQMQHFGFDRKMIRGDLKKKYFF